MGALSLIIRREFNAKVRNKSFIVMTFLSPLLLAGVVFLIGYLSTMKSAVTRIAVLDESGLFSSAFQSSDTYHFDYKSQVPLAALADSVSQEKIAGVLYIPALDSVADFENNIQYISNESPKLGFVEYVESAINEKLTQRNFELANLDTNAIRAAESDISVNLSKVSGEESLRGVNEIKVAIGGGMGYLIMMFIIIYGNMVMRSVIEEKTNRIVEVIISSVKPFQLMMGKIIGTSLAGVLQFVIWAVIGVGLLFGISAVMGVDAGAVPQADVAAQGQMMEAYIRELWNFPIATTILAFVIYFIGGYFLYSSFYAAIGAAVDNETDSQQFLFPIITPLMLGVYIGFFTVINEPHGQVATIFSMIPLTSPIVMLMRIPFGVPLWQLALSIAILFGTFISVVWVSAKIYRTGILMYGKKPSWKEMLRWVRY